MRLIIKQLEFLNLKQLTTLRNHLKHHLTLLKKESLAPGSQADLNKPDFQFELDSPAKEGAILQVVSPAIFKLCVDMNKKVRATTAEEKETEIEKTDIEKAYDLINKKNNIKKNIAIDDVFPVLIQAIKKTSGEKLEKSQVIEMCAKCEIVLEIVNLVDSNLGGFAWGLLTLSQALCCYKQELEENMYFEIDEAVNQWADEFIKTDESVSVKEAPLDVTTLDIEYCLEQFDSLKKIKLHSEKLLPELLLGIKNYENDQRQVLEKMLRTNPAIFNRYCKAGTDIMKPTQEIISLIKRHRDFFCFVKQKAGLSLVYKCGLILAYEAILKNTSKKCTERLDELEIIVESTAGILIEERSYSDIQFFQCLAEVFHRGGYVRGQKIIEDKLHSSTVMARLFFKAKDIAIEKAGLTEKIKFVQSCVGPR